MIGGHAFLNGVSLKINVIPTGWNSNSLTTVLLFRTLTTEPQRPYLDNEARFSFTYHFMRCLSAKKSLFLIEFQSVDNSLQSVAKLVVNDTYGKNDMFT